MISVDGDTEIPLKGDGGCEWSCAGIWKVVRLPGRGVWKRIPQAGIERFSQARAKCSGAQLVAVAMARSYCLELAPPLMAKHCLKVPGQR
jgi:hypothetical protein